MEEIYGIGCRHSGIGVSRWDSGCKEQVVSDSMLQFIMINSPNIVEHPFLMCINFFSVLFV